MAPPVAAVGRGANPTDRAGGLRFLVVGDPVSHSRSPAIHTEALRLAGLKGRYGTRRVLPGELPPVLEAMRAGELDGINVTMPLKGEAFAAAEHATPEAERSASVNTMRCRTGVVEGHSTDVEAFSEVFSEWDGSLLVLGAGGSARAALAAWRGRPAFVSARDPARAAFLGEPVPWGSPVPGALVVNTTPLGMGGEELPEPVLDNASRLVDLPYGYDPTPAVVRAESAGLPVIDGLEFLARQAAASFEWWTGVRVDLASLSRAARNG